MTGGEKGSRAAVPSQGPVAGDCVPADPWPRIPDSRVFPQEVWQRGEPEMRPARGRAVIARTVGMAALEKEFRNCALYATLLGDARVLATPAALAAAIDAHCAVRRVKVQVACPPYNFFLQFESEADCTRVVHVSEKFKCAGAWVSFQRWHRSSRGTKVNFKYKALLSLEGIPEECWDHDTVNLVLAGVEGELIQMLPASDKWVLPLTAWLRNPSDVPKVLTVSIPAPPNEEWKPDSDDENLHSPPVPSSPRDRATFEFSVIIHVKEVVDHGPLLAVDLHDDYLPGEGEDLSRKHKFKTWRGKIDGTGPGPYGSA